jgi:hypothetical protein
VISEEIGKMSMKYSSSKKEGGGVKLFLMGRNGCTVFSWIFWE